MERVRERMAAGDVYIGCGESDAMFIVLRAMDTCHKKHPLVKFHLFNDTSADLNDCFKDGLLGFVVEFELARYCFYAASVLQGRRSI